jgi:DNA-directed RNA polymerase specialized sigma24 family protein
VRKHRAATAENFNAFIEWLDAGSASGGQSYIDMHARLVSYFTRKGCTTPDTLADETLTRVARRLHEEGTIAGVAPAQYCYIVARYVMLEHFRSAEHDRRHVVRDVRDGRAATDSSQTEPLLARLDDCLAKLKKEDRALILAYYAGDGASRIKTRQVLASKHGLSANALTIRASRLRERLRACVGSADEP